MQMLIDLAPLTDLRWPNVQCKNVVTRMCGLDGRDASCKKLLPLMMLKSGEEAANDTEKVHQKRW